MNALTPTMPVATDTNLPALVDRAARALAGAKTAAEVLEARELAGQAYDAAKRASRFGKKKQAHDELISVAYKAQAHALEIESGAKLRLSEEYAAAAERKEIAGHGGDRTSKIPDENLALPTTAELGITQKDIYEARIVRDAEAANPGITRKTLDQMLEEGGEPTRAALRKELLTAAQQAGRRAPTPRQQPAASHVSDPNFDAMAAVAGSCRSILSYKEQGVAYIHAGFLDEAMKQRNLELMRECRNFLSLIIGD